MRKVCASENTSPTLIVDLARRRKIVADRLFQHHARLRRHQPGAARDCGRPARTDRATWRDRTPAPARDRATSAARSQSASGWVRVEADVMQAGAEALHRILVQVGGGDMVLQRLAPHAWRNASSARSERAAPMMRDSGGICPSQQPVVQRRQQLAQRQVAGGAEHHAIEHVHRYDLAAIESCLPSPVKRERVGEGHARRTHYPLCLPRAAWRASQRNFTPQERRRRPY